MKKLFLVGVASVFLALGSVAAGAKNGHGGHHGGHHGHHGHSGHGHHGGHHYGHHGGRYRHLFLVGPGIFYACPIIIYRGARYYDCWWNW